MVWFFESIAVHDANENGMVKRLRLMRYQNTGLLCSYTQQ
jgi:hypothetical protein